MSSQESKIFHSICVNGFSKYCLKNIVSRNFLTPFKNGDILCFNFHNGCFKSVSMETKMWQENRFADWFSFNEWNGHNLLQRIEKHAKENLHKSRDVPNLSQFYNLYQGLRQASLDWLDFRLEPIFTIAPVAPKHSAQFKRGPKWPKTNLLASFVNVQSKSLVHSLEVLRGFYIYKHCFSYNEEINQLVKVWVTTNHVQNAYNTYF